jgi:putative hydrolase of the HAD superfamily
MPKQALFLDLDNTVYPVISIGEKLFQPLLALLEQSNELSSNLAQIKTEIMRRPFQWVAKEFDFKDNLKMQCLNLLSDLTYNEPISPFADYQFIKELNCSKYLITTGFSKLQWSKINQLNIQNDFKAIFVIDPSYSDLTKKDIFQKIMLENNYINQDILVVGDDLQSEIKAAQELGIEAILYLHQQPLPESENQKTIHHFKALQSYFL